MLTQDANVRPDSFYGVSKAFGENLGRFYAENGGPKFYAIRIGALVHEDHPYAHAERGVISGKWERDSPQYNLMVKRLKSLWISKRDFVQLINLCLQYNAPNYDSFYAVSNNPRRWLDIEYPRKRLGYEPQDNAEEWLSPPQLDTIITTTSDEGSS
jgi:nucleoside-diphosphate-sugar epimerase